MEGRLGEAAHTRTRTLTQRKKGAQGVTAGRRARGLEARSPSSPEACSAKGHRPISWGRFWPATAGAGPAVPGFARGLETGSGHEAAGHDKAWTGRWQPRCPVKHLDVASAVARRCFVATAILARGGGPHEGFSGCCWALTPD